MAAATRTAAAALDIERVSRLMTTSLRRGRGAVLGPAARVPRRRAAFRTARAAMWRVLCARSWPVPPAAGRLLPPPRAAERRQLIGARLPLLGRSSHGPP